jgi:hypothetical protein
MAERKTVDTRPGAMPDIRAEGDAITFHLTIAGVGERAQLVIRCDPGGGVRVSIDHVESSRAA